MLEIVQLISGTIFLVGLGFCFGCLYIRSITVKNLTSTNTQSNEIAALRKRLSNMESEFHEFVMLHESDEGFDSLRI